MNMRAMVLVAMVCGAQAAFGQSAVDHIAMGDQANAEMNLTGALQHYQAALQMDSMNVEALWKASRETVDLGEFKESADERTALYRQGESFARRAVAADPNSSMAHFALAKAVGRAAQAMGTRDRIKYAGEVRREALEALRLDSTNAGALHVMGEWNAEVMRLNGFSRFLAKNLLGGKIFGEASWDEATSYLERSVALEPDRIVHRLALGQVYADRDRKADAREQLEKAVSLPATEYNDRFYKQQAEKRLGELK